MMVVAISKFVQYYKDIYFNAVSVESSFQGFEKQLWIV